MLQGQWSSERLTGVEALLRWQGLEVGELAPSHFIPIAEQDGFITRIGDWVLEQASSAATNWLEHLVSPIYLCVNVSPQQFVKAVHYQSDRASEAGTLARPGHAGAGAVAGEHAAAGGRAPGSALPPARLGRAFRRRQPGHRPDQLRSAAALPGRHAEDRPPALSRKVDSHPASADLVAEIASIGERFQLRVVAVGVETPEQLQTLRGLGDMEVQGYLLSPPVPIGEFQQLLAVGKQRKESQ